MNKKILKIVMVVCLGILGVFGGMFGFGEKNVSALTEIDITIPEDIIEGGSGSGGSSGGGNSSGSHSFGGGGENESDNSGKSLDERLECNNIVKESGAKIGPMQWILCPSMDNSRYTATWVDNLTQDWLEQDTEDYKPGSAAEIGWGYVRNIANVVMVIFLMIVIFSQLTGRGIDNYGIKKMLPRLIVMAIVVNLSFYICVVLVDLSNIAGEGLKNMFGSIGTQIAGDQQVTGAPFLGAMIAGLFSAAGGAGAAVGAGLTVAGLGLTATALVPVIIAVVVLCLIILAAVMTLFLMLGARRIIVIFCIVIAPLAFASFILPNTQNLFKKWWELLKTALIIFPICGALGGISYMLRAIALTGNARYSVVELILLMLLPYLSFFLLPMLLKNALAALGKLGGALTSMGNTIRNGGRAIGQGAMRVAQNTEGYKNLQNEAARQRQQRYAQRTVDRVNERERAGRELSERDKRRRLNAQQTLNKLEMEKAMADVGVPVVDENLAGLRAASAKESQEFKNYTDQYGILTRAQMGSELNDAVSAYNGDRSDVNATRLQAAIAVAEDKGMNREILNSFYDSGIGLSASDGNDAKILSRLAASSNKVISQYGIQTGKQSPIGADSEHPASVMRTSLKAFTEGTSTIPDLSLSTALGKKGSGIITGMDDDTLEYINNYNPNAVTTEMLIRAAQNTTNNKELGWINKMLETKARSGVSDYTIRPSELANLRLDTVNSMNPALYQDALTELRNTASTDASRQIINAMDQNVRAKFGLNNITVASPNISTNQNIVNNNSVSQNNNTQQVVEVRNMNNNTTNANTNSDISGAEYDIPRAPERPINPNYTPPRLSGPISTPDNQPPHLPGSTSGENNA